MAESLVLGVDATSAGTTAILVRDDVVVSRYNEGPLDVLLDPYAFDRLASMIKESGAGWAGLGLAGIQGANEASRLEAMLRAKTGVRVTVGDDAEIALLGAFEGAPGIVVVAHTGSNAFGRDGSGRAARVGGYGHLLGDEGSHYWIAARAINAAFLSRDGRGPSAPALEQAITSAYGLDLDGVMRHVHESARDLGAVARVARVVMNVDDPVMNAILVQAADDLITHVEALHHRLGPLPVAMHGGVFANREIRARFVAATGAVEPARPPEYGAVLLATKAAPSRDMGWRTT